MTDLSEQRCRNHADREAVARCPQCRKYFCRECVVEHDDRMLCAPCLKKLGEGTSRRTRRLLAAWRFVQCLSSVLLLWIFFFLLGRALLAVPSETHSESMWTVRTTEDSE